MVRSALALARAWPAGEARKIRQVVAEMGVPQTFASQILADLVRAGLASSKAGKDGGYRLSRPPEEIPLVEVVEAGEGPLRAERCALGDGPCRWDAVCPLHETWRAATDALRQVLGATTLADLAKRDVELEEGHGALPVGSHRHGGATVVVDDWVYAESGMEAVTRRLQNQDPDLLATVIEAAYQDADALRMNVRPATRAWSPVQAHATCEARPERLVDAGHVTAEAHAFAVSWEAVGADGTTSHADLELLVSPVDPARTRVHLEGRLRPTESPSGLPPDADLLARLAQVVVRSLLRRLARQLELPPPVGDRAASRRSRRSAVKDFTAPCPEIKATVRDR